MAYGTTIMDWKLVRRSMVTEVLSLAYCIVVGAVIAAIFGTTTLARSWPTEEMVNRGQWSNFFVGIPIAFFSGLGVAVSLLDEQTSSLVGVAISASLLPPAVNAGILWVAYSFAQYNIVGGTGYLEELRDETLDLSEASFTVIETRSGKLNVSLNTVVAEAILRYIDSKNYSHDEYNKMGALSLGLTVINIALIWISSMFMFRMKEVLPIRKKIFWEDIGVARKIYTDKAFLRSEEVEQEKEEAEEE